MFIGGDGRLAIPEHHAWSALVSHLEWDDGVTAPPEVGRRPF